MFPHPLSHARHAARLFVRLPPTNSPAPVLLPLVVLQLVSSVSGTNVGPNVNIVLAGIAKLFVGEMVETGEPLRGGLDL